MIHNAASNRLSARWSGSVGNGSLQPAPTRTVVQPARRPASTSRQRSPTMTHRPRSTPASAAACCRSPGRGFRQSQPSASSCQQTRTSSRSSVDAHLRVDRLDALAVRRPTRHVRLIRDDHEPVPVRPKQCTRPLDAGQELELGEIARRQRRPVGSEAAAVEDAVAVEEDDPVDSAPPTPTSPSPPPRAGGTRADGRAATACLRCGVSQPLRSRLARRCTRRRPARCARRPAPRSPRFGHRSPGRDPWRGRDSR